MGCFVLLETHDFAKGVLTDGKKSLRRNFCLSMDIVQQSESAKGIDSLLRSPVYSQGKLGLQSCAVMPFTRKIQSQDNNPPSLFFYCAMSPQLTVNDTRMNLSSRDRTFDIHTGDLPTRFPGSLLSFISMPNYPTNYLLHLPI